MFTCFNVGAISGAHAAKHATPMVLGDFERYKPEPTFIVQGSISLMSSPDIKVEPDYVEDGVTIKFRNLAGVIRTIDKLTRLRDSMIELEEKEVNKFERRIRAYENYSW